MPSYDPNNIFAKILRGELPCHKVYEDDKALAFLDIMPRAPGHTLVLPKAPARNLLDVDPADLAHVMQVAQKIARAGMKAFGADGVTVQQFNESAGGQVVFHLHVHVIPRRDQGVRRGRHHGAAVQRKRRRTGGVSPPRPCDPAQGRRAVEAARKCEGRGERAVGSSAQVVGGVAWVGLTHPGRIDCGGKVPPLPSPQNKHTETT